MGYISSAASSDSSSQEIFNKIHGIDPLFASNNVNRDVSKAPASSASLASATAFPAAHSLDQENSSSSNVESSSSSRASQDGILDRVSRIARSVWCYTTHLFSSQRKESESSAAASSSLALATVFPSASTLAQGSSSISHSESSSSSSASSSIGNAPGSSSSLSASSNAQSRAAPSSAPASLASASCSLSSVAPFPATHALVAQGSSSSSSEESRGSSSSASASNSSVSCSSTASAIVEAAGSRQSVPSLQAIARPSSLPNQKSGIFVDGNCIKIDGRKYILVQVNRDGTTKSVSGDSLSPVLQGSIATIYGIFAEILRTTQNSSENMAKAQYTVTYQIPNLQAPTIKKVVQKISNSRDRGEPLIPSNKKLNNIVYGISTVHGAFLRIIDLLHKPQLTINGFGDSEDNLSYPPSHNPLSRRKMRILQKRSS